MSEYTDPKNVVDAEIVTDVTDASGSSRSYGHEEAYYRVKSDGTHTEYTMFSAMSPNDDHYPQRHLAFVVTFVLLLACLLQWGFLAALGFAFFYLVGSCIGIYFTFKNIMEGKMPNVWLYRAAIWGISLLLVSWLV